MPTKASDSIRESGLDYPEEPKALAVRRPPTLMPAADAPPQDWPTNLDLSTPAGRAALINASNPADWIPQDGGTFRLTVVNWIVYPDEKKDPKTGEIRPVAVTVFIGADGRTAKLHNDWSPRRLHAMLRMYTPEEWAAGIDMEFASHDSRNNGFHYGSFRIIPTTSPVQE
jgi:hypothetical protein